MTANIDNLLAELDTLRTQISSLQDEKAPELPQYSSTTTHVTTHDDGSVEIGIILYPGNEGISSEPIDATVVEPGQVPGPPDAPDTPEPEITVDTEPINGVNDTPPGEVAPEGESTSTVSQPDSGGDYNADTIPPGEVAGE